MNMKITGLLVASFLALLLGACTKSCNKSGDVAEGNVAEQQAAEGDVVDGEKVEAAVFFESLKDGDQIASPVTIKFGVKGMTVRPALENVDDKTSGHHHLLIDSPAGFVEKGQVVPADERNIHYGNGETEATIELAPGVHTLSLQFADGAHISYGKELANTITVTVVGAVPVDAEEDQDQD